MLECGLTFVGGIGLRPLLLALGSVLLYGCSDEAASGGGGGWPGAGGGGRPAALVVTAPTEVRAIADVVEAVGTTLANESVTVTAKVTDAIRRVRFEDGDFVAEGDVLVELTNQEQTALLAEAEANLIDARTQHTRLNDLLTQGSVPVSDVDEARARLSAATARYQAIVARLSDRLIRAPFSGVLGFRTVSAGTLITPGTAITTLDDISVIKLDFAIPEVHFGEVRPGLALTAHSVAFPDREFTASVETVSSRINPVTRAVPVRALIDNSDLLLRPGMLMTVRLTTASRDSLMVPETALLQRGENTFVYTVEEGRAAMTAIDLGIRRGGWAEAITGLSVGQPVITEGVIKVRPGVPVRVAGNESPGPGRGGPPGGRPGRPAAAGG